MKTPFPPIFRILWIGTLINRLGTFVFPFMTVYLTAQRKVDVATAGLVVACFGVGKLAAAFLGGHLADVVGRRFSILLGLVAGAGFMAVTPFVGPLGALAAALVLTGLFTELYRPAVSAILADVLPPELQARGFASLYVSINIGAALAPVLGGMLAERSFTLLFLADAATMLAYAAIVWARVPETMPSRDEAAHATSPAAFRVALGDPLLLGVCGCTLVFSTLLLQCMVTLPVVMLGEGLSATQYGLAVGVNGAVVVALSIPLSRVVEGRGPLRVLTLASVLMGAGWLAALPAHSTFGYATSVVVWTFGEILFAAVGPALVASLAPAHARGTYQGFFAAAWGVAAVVAPAGGAAALAAWGADTLWIGSFVAGLGTAVAFLALRPFALGRIRTGVRVVGSGAAG